MKSGYVYAIRAGTTDHVKVGYSISPVGRIAALQAGCPEQLHLIAEARAGRATERALHDMLSDSRIHGEWFVLPARLDWLLLECFAAIDLYTDAGAEERPLVVALLEEMCTERTAQAAAA